MGDCDLLLTFFLVVGVIVIAILALVLERSFGALWQLHKRSEARIEALEVIVAELQEKGGAS